MRPYAKKHYKEIQKSLDYLEATKPCSPIVQEETKEVPMNGYINGNLVTPAYMSATSSADLTLKAQEYLQHRADILWSQKVSKAEQEFGIADDFPPENPKELVDRIKAGMFLISPENLMIDTYHPTDYIRWRDPAKVMDQEGFKTRRAELEKEYTKLRDSIMVKFPEETLPELQAWGASA